MVGLPGTVDAHHQNDKRFFVRIGGKRAFYGLEDVQHGFAKTGLQCVNVLQLAPCKAFLQVGDDPFRGVNANIGHNETCLDFLEHVVIDFAAGCEVGQIVGQPAVAPVQAGAEALDEARAFFGSRLFRFSKHN